MFAGTRIGLGKAGTLVIIFTLVISAGDYFWIGRESLKTETRDVYQFKNQLLQDKLSQNPGDINIMLDLAVSQYLQGNSEGAFNTLQSIIEQDTKNSTAFFYLGLIYVDMKDYRNAILFLEKVVSLNPALQPRLLYYNLGLAYFETGAYDKAAKALKVASEVNPGSGPASFYLGMAYFKLGQYQNARTALEKAVSIGENAVEAKKTLQDIGLQLKKKIRKQNSPKSN